jgi:hypothetical protein
MLRVLEDKTCRSYYDTVGTAAGRRSGPVHVLGSTPGRPAEMASLCW